MFIGADSKGPILFRKSKVYNLYLVSFLRFLHTLYRAVVFQNRFFCSTSKQLYVENDRAYFWINLKLHNSVLHEKKT